MDGTKDDSETVVWPPIPGRHENNTYRCASAACADKHASNVGK